MKTNFVSVMRYLILCLVVLSGVIVMRYMFTRSVSLRFTEIDSAWLSQTLLFVTLILASLFVHEFQKPKDCKSWFTLVTIWGFNIFTLLFIMGVIDLGEEARTANYIILTLITLIIDLLAFFPYEIFMKKEIKPQ